LDEMLVILPLIGVSAFERLEVQAAPAERLYLRGKSAEATGAEKADGFVFEGSLARSDTVPSIHTYLRTLRERLVNEGILLSSQDYLRFARSYLFESPSTAAGVLLGRSANGRREWKTAGGQTPKERQERDLDDSAIDPAFTSHVGGAGAITP
jgi:hypothetical protein